MSKLRIFSSDESESLLSGVAITGIGLVTSLGHDRETVWHALQRGDLGAKYLEDFGAVKGLDLPAACVEWPDRKATASQRAIEFALIAASEALQDSELKLSHIDRERFAVSTSAHFGDTTFCNDHHDKLSEPSRAWWDTWYPNSACAKIATSFGLLGPRTVHATACASSLISVILAARNLLDHQCDYAIAGGMDALHPLVAASFQRMGVLAPSAGNPGVACRPFDSNRNGFVIGEAAAMLVLERTEDAVRRGAPIYGEIVATKMLSEASHVTSLDENSVALTYLLKSLLKTSNWSAEDVGYINAHGTGTEQNDRNELTAISKVFGNSPQDLKVSSIKGMVGHTINAAGGLELATTLLAMRDGYAPSTRNLISQEAIGDIDCLGEYGVECAIDNAIKMSVAFGGHLAGVAIRKPKSVATRSRCSLDRNARIRIESKVPAMAPTLRRAA
jgi:3-oxoacyl-(acyl-carrier-protein) synthase